MDTSHDIDSIRLTSSEIGELWTNYVYESLSKCVLTYFLVKCTDKDISSLVEKNLNLTIKNLETIITGLRKFQKHQIERFLQMLKGLHPLQSFIHYL